ncbi:hypothetical protein [Flaviflagellibacter deserti]|uniref:Uncharacterized protein n=1 Tax=Flaviflagellibacter deserti TaxID=2267266 RepID=A0ABV9Z0K8_9HYPH
MSLKTVTIAVVAASLALGTAAPAFAGWNGPNEFQNKPNPKFPGPGPKDFKAPPKKAGPKPHHHGPAFGALMGVGVLTAAAIAASQDDEECWQERRKGGRIVTVCVED